MNKQFKVSALRDRRFKAPVTILLASDELGADGQLTVDTLKIAGVFRSVPDDEIRLNLQKLDELRTQEVVKSTELMDETRRQIKSYLVGVEKHPEHDWPFYDDAGQPVASSPELIDRLLEVREIRDAVEQAYKDARNSAVLEKNLKK